MLAKAGLEGWDKLFVSNAEGGRKDNGQLFEQCAIVIKSRLKIW
jgi:hypothetical protein